MPPLIGHIVQKLLLSQAADHITSFVDPAQLLGEETYIGLEHIAKDTGQLLDTGTVSDVTSKIQPFERGDVLYGRMRPYLRKVLVADRSGFASGEILVIRCREQLLPQYLQMLMISPRFTEFATSMSRGDRPRVSFKSIRDLELELPSLDTQRIITSHHLALKSASQTAQKNFDDTINAAERQLRTIRDECIWGGNYTVVALSELVRQIQYGTSARSAYDTAGSAILRIPNLRADGTVDSSDLKFANLTPDDAKKYSLEKNDLLVIRSNGSASLVGRGALVGLDHVGHAFAGYLLRVQLKDTTFAPYLAQVFRSERFRELLAPKIRSTTGINNLSAGRLASVMVPVPPLGTHAPIAERLEDIEGALYDARHKVAQLNSATRAAHDAFCSSFLQRTAETFPADDTTFGTATATQQRQPDERLASRSLTVEGAKQLVLERLRAKGEPTAFQDLFDSPGTHYDLLREAVFSLLNEVPAQVVQEYDQDRAEVRLRSMHAVA